MEMDGSQFSVSQPKRGLVYDINQFITPTPSVERTNNYSTSFLMQVYLNGHTRKMILGSWNTLKKNG